MVSLGAVVSLDAIPGEDLMWPERRDRKGKGHEAETLRALYSVRPVELGEQGAQGGGGGRTCAAAGGSVADSTLRPEGVWPPAPATRFQQKGGLRSAPSMEGPSLLETLMHTLDLGVRVPFPSLEELGF